MLLIGYLYGIKSERRLEKDITFNLVYWWFCGIALMRSVPDHSTCSQNRRRRFRESSLFRDLFNEIVLQCIKIGIVSGETGVADGSFLSSNISWEKCNETVVVLGDSTVKYLDELDVELSSMPGYIEPIEQEGMLKKPYRPRV